MSAQTWLEMSRRLLKNIHAYKCWNAVVPHQKHPLSPPSPNVRVGYEHVMWRWLDLDFSVPNISYRSHINLHLRRAIKKLKRAKLASFSSTLCRREIFVWFAARTLQCGASYHVSCCISASVGLELQTGDYRAAEAVWWIHYQKSAAASCRCRNWSIMSPVLHI